MTCTALCSVRAIWCWAGATFTSAPPGHPRWTRDNAGGIGGAYLCVYGMEGPGGYQFVGRTLQMWNTFHSTTEFPPGTPWLLRFFDELPFYSLSAAELLECRAAFSRGR